MKFTDEEALQLMREGAKLPKPGFGALSPRANMVSDPKNAITPAEALNKIEKWREGLPTDWVQDIADMHTKFGFNEKTKKMDTNTLKALLNFRIAFLNEELTELQEAKSADDVVDACIDLIVIAIGTLNLFEVDANLAWNRVHGANMSKQAGIKPGRKFASVGLDLMKPDGWTAPTHVDNVGLLQYCFGVQPSQPWSGK